MSWLPRLVLVGFVSVGGPQLFGEPDQNGSTVEHVRSTETRILETLHEGVRHSATFKSFVDRLNQTDAIVYVEHGICGFGHYQGCLSHSIAAVGTTRYLRVIIDARVGGAQEIALIAHELRHALEIAADPKIRTADDVTRLFRLLGRSPHCPPGTPDCYETSAALAAGEAVLREVVFSLNELHTHAR
jgi:hypothetical protein